MLFICFAVHRAYLRERRSTPPWFDCLFILGAIAIAVYLALTFQKLATSGTVVTQIVTPNLVYDLIGAGLAAAGLVVVMILAKRQGRLHWREI